jgi:hypothetical protein
LKHAASASEHVVGFPTNADPGARVWLTRLPETLTGWVPRRVTSRSARVAGRVSAGRARGT